MAKPKRASSITIESPYADYAFYQCLYSRSRSFKFLESEGAVFMIEHLMARAPALRKRPIDIVEFLAGAGEYEQFIRTEARFKIGKYVGIDAIKPPDAKTELLVGPVESTFPDWKADAVLALFYSASSVLGADGKPSPTALLDMAQNAHRNLKKDGGFILSFPARGESLSFREDEENDDETEIAIPIYNGLRERFGLAPVEEAVIRYKSEERYERSTGLSIEHIKKARVVRCGDETVMGRITINEPMYQQYLSESHFIWILREAGFREFMFFDINADDGTPTYERLPDVMTETEQYANHIVAVR
ncbi:MAG: hypothetical protein HQ495_07715 [Alphaproteobacteria bacterium]|nr:hypothetical protein [Alphaproteobacteria bacterium]